jgi:hypothetical protein
VQTNEMPSKKNSTNNAFSRLHVRKVRTKLVGSAAQNERMKRREEKSSRKGARLNQAGQNGCTRGREVHAYFRITILWPGRDEMY